MKPCTKIKYSSRKKAHFAMRSIMKAGKAMRAYLCPQCKQYHLTSDLHSTDWDYK